MKVVFLSSKGYDDEAQNHGDSVLIDTGKKLIIFDCGCEEHARRVINYMNSHNYPKASFILSHNDSDHFDGLPFLLNEGKISVVYTTLLLKHVDELLKIINDKRRNRETLKKTNSGKIFEHCQTLRRPFKRYLRRFLLFTRRRKYRRSFKAVYVRDRC